VVITTFRCFRYTLHIPYLNYYPFEEVIIQRCAHIRKDHENQSVPSSSLVLKLVKYLGNPAGWDVNSSVAANELSGYSLSPCLFLCHFTVPHPTSFKIPENVHTSPCWEQNFRFWRKYVVFRLERREM